jgi:hypothetical protein
MLSEHEQWVWDDIERFWTEDAVEPPRSVPVDGVTVGVATALGWSLWHYWPRLGDMGSATAWPVFGAVHPDLFAARPPAEQPRAPRPQRGR